MWAAVRENCDFCTCGSNNWETVEDRWVHAVIRPVHNFGKSRDSRASWLAMPLRIVTVFVYYYYFNF